MKAKGFSKYVKACGALAVIAVLLVALTACAGTEAQTEKSSAEESSASAEQASTEAVRVASLKGPTSMGLVGLMDSADKGKASQAYDFTIAGTADEIVPSIIGGDLDIALLPANVAAMLYSRTDGGVQVMDINTLGVLSVVTGNADIKDFSDLKYQTIVMTGKGTTPQYVMEYLLEKAGILPTVEFDYKSETTEVAALLKESPETIAVLPQPYVTSITGSGIGVSAVIDLNDVWNTFAEDQSALVTGVTVVRSEFAEQYPEKVAAFLEDQQQSVTWVNENTGEAGELVASLGIVNNAEIATAAIPQCHLVCVAGGEMKTMLEGYLNVLYASDAQSVGGAVPPEGFYYFVSE